MAKLVTLVTQPGSRYVVVFGFGFLAWLSGLVGWGRLSENRFALIRSLFFFSFNLWSRWSFDIMGNLMLRWSCALTTIVFLFDSMKSLPLSVWPSISSINSSVSVSLSSCSVHSGRRFLTSSLLVGFVKIIFLHSYLRTASKWLQFGSIFLVLQLVRNSL